MPKNAYIPANVINATLNPATDAKASPAVTTTTAPPTSGRALRQLFINYLTLRQLIPRTVQSYIEWILQLSRFHDRSPDLLGNEEIKVWLWHLIARPYSASSLNLASNAVRSNWILRSACSPGEVAAGYLSAYSLQPRAVRSAMLSSLRHPHHSAAALRCPSVAGMPRC